MAAMLPLAVGLLMVGPAAALSSQTGSVTAFGDAVAYGSPVGSELTAPLSGIASTHDGKGYWLLGADGGVFSYGDASFYGSQAGYGVGIRYVGMASTPDGHGYWLANYFGSVYNFGDAVSEPSLGVPLAAPAVGIASDPAAMGYWLAGADGGVFSFGNAHFYGSMGGVHLNAPVVGVASTPGGGGYWLVAADGGVFSFGNARFYGSLGASPSSSLMPVVGMASNPSGGGYWLTTTDKELPPPTPVPSVLDECNVPGSAPSVRPASIMLACGDGNASLIYLTWTSWTATTATGSGYYRYNTCTPNCAEGTFLSTPASVRLSYPIQTSAGQEFAAISYTYANPSVPEGSSTQTEVIPTSPA